MAITDYVALRRVANQSIPGATPTTISWDTEVSDASNYWTSGTPTKIIPPAGKDGIHVITAVFTQNPAANTRAFLAVEIYNSSNVFLRSARYALGVQEDTGHLCTVTKLAVGDYFSFTVYQSSGAFNLTARLEVVRLA